MQWGGRLHSTLKSDLASALAPSLTSWVLTKTAMEQLCGELFILSAPPFPYLCNADNSLLLRGFVRLIKENACEDLGTVPPPTDGSVPKGWLALLSFSSSERRGRRVEKGRIQGLEEASRHHPSQRCP